MTDALVHLRAYPSGKLDPAEADAVESLIALYLDGHLEPEVADQVMAAIEADAAVAAVVDDAREGKAWVEDVFAPESRRLMQQPASQGTIDLIHDLVAGAEPQPSEDSTVVPLRTEVPRHETGWQSWLMAASIAALLVAGGATFYVMQNRLHEAGSRQLALEQQIDLLTAEREESESHVTALDTEIIDLQDQLKSAEELRATTAAELGEASSTIATLQDQQGSLGQQVATLQEELASTSDQAERLDQQRTALAGDVDRLQAALTAAETEREQAASSLVASEQDMAELRAELERLRIAFAEADDIRGTAMTELAGARSTIDTLRIEQAEAEQRLAAFDVALQQAGDQAAVIEQERSVLAGEIDQLQAAIADASSERDNATSALAAADQARGDTAEQLAEAETTIEALEGDRTDLQRRLAAAALQVQTASSSLDDRDRQLAALGRELTTAQTAASDARNQIAQLAIERRDFDAELAALRASQRWLPQVAQYHAFYARLPARRWVEESAEQREELNNLLVDLGRALELDRALPLPQPLQGLDFAGGRPLPVNGMPVVQLAYVDPDDQLFAFCFMRNPTGETKEPKPQRISDLTLVSWSDAKFQYVVIGYEPVAFVSDIAQQLRESYRLDT